jgi:hypothetical protein
LRNRPRGDKCSQQGNRLKLTVVRKIWAGHPPDGIFGNDRPGSAAAVWVIEAGQN